MKLDKQKDQIIFELAKHLAPGLIELREDGLDTLKRLVWVGFREIKQFNKKQGMTMFQGEEEIRKLISSACAVRLNLDNEAYAKYVEWYRKKHKDDLK